MKWKNYGLWISISSILYMVFRDIGIEIDLTTWETYVTAILGILATLGVIANPEKGRGYFQRKPKPSTSQLIEEVVLQVMKNLESSKSQDANNELSNSELPTSNIQEPQATQNTQTMENQYANNEELPSNYQTEQDTLYTEQINNEEIPPNNNIGERLPFEK